MFSLVKRMIMLIMLIMFAHGGPPKGSPELQLSQSLQRNVVLRYLSLRLCVLRWALYVMSTSGCTILIQSGCMTVLVLF
jgi:hypothetical protein